MSLEDDIMVLASPRPPPPVDPDDVNTHNSKNILFQILYEGRYDLTYFAIEI